MHDVVIIGAGAAGTTTAYYLRDSGLDVAVLEAGDHVGGRALSVDVGGLTVNTGAMFVYRGTRAEELAAELGISTEPFEPSTYGIHLDGQTVVDTDNERMVKRLPLDDDARSQLVRFIDEAMTEYQRYTRGGAMMPEAAELAGISVQDKLDGWHPDVQRIVQTAVQGGAVGKASQTSATYGLRYFASYLAHEKHNRLFPPNGMQELIQRMADRLPEGWVRLGVRVTGVRDTDGGYDVHAVGADGAPATFSARRVVVALPAPQVHEVLPDLPEWKRAALEQAATPGSRTLGVVADVTEAPHVADWAFVTTVDRAFDAIINPAPGRPRRDPGSGRLLAQYVCYGNSAGHEAGFGERPGSTDAWVEDFLAVAPELRGRIRGVHGQTWPHCFAVLAPARLAVLDELRRPLGGVEFAGDYTSATAGTHGCYDEARRVADRLTQRGALDTAP
jgi:protoporphyrinogen oxidase